MAKKNGLNQIQSTSIRKPQLEAKFLNRKSFVGYVFYVVCISRYWE